MIFQDFSTTFSINPALHTRSSRPKTPSCLSYSPYNFGDLPSNYYILRTTVSRIFIERWGGRESSANQSVAFFNYTSQTTCDWQTTYENLCIFVCSQMAVKECLESLQTMLLQHGDWENLAPNGRLLSGDCQNTACQQVTSI